MVLVLGRIGKTIDKGVLQHLEQERCPQLLVLGFVRTVSILLNFILPGRAC